MNITLPRADVWAWKAVVEEAQSYTSCKTWSPSMTEELAVVERQMVAALAQPQADEYAVRGHLASRLHCWHKLTEEEADELVVLFMAQPQELHCKDCEHSRLKDKASPCDTCIPSFPERPMFKARSAQPATQQPIEAQHLKELEEAEYALLAILDKAGEGATVADVLSILEAVRAQPATQQAVQVLPLHETEAMHDAVMQVLYSGRIGRGETDRLWQAYRKVLVEAQPATQQNPRNEVLEHQPHAECDSPEICRVAGRCAGQYDTKKICGGEAQPAPTGEPVAWWKPEFQNPIVGIGPKKPMLYPEARPLFTTPQPRKLTDDDLEDIAVAARSGNLFDLRRAVEAAITGGQA